ncbi:Arm DNA-binding domain-containing protein [Lonsdalea iberica]|uniref:Arm DNA-binding domain-containing protein n=1 Tax=Lonsdalea iberica TaxID=1082703 RepID=UPI0030845A35
MEVACVFRFRNQEKVWQVRYQFEGKEKVHTIGKYPKISPAVARDTITTRIDTNAKKRI